MHRYRQQPLISSIQRLLLQKNYIIRKSKSERINELRVKREQSIALLFSKTRNNIFR